MCSSKAVSTVARVATGVSTFGTSELVRKVPVVGNIAKLPERAASTAAVGLGLVKPDAPDAPPIPDPAAPGPEGPGSNTEPPATVSASDPTELAAQLRRRRLAAMGRGIAATIASSASGDTSNPSLLSPTASGGTPSVYAAGMKAKLGQ